jgi:MATE family multidrug resistance protein
LQENLAGVRVVKAFVRADHERERFGRVNDALMQRTVHGARLVATVRPFMMLTLNLGVVAVIWFGGVQVSRGDLQVGQIIAFVNYLMRTLFSLMMVRLGAVDGATTQIVVMLTSIAYLPGVGLALAGTTLVGQAIGAGDRDWARRLGNAVIVITTAYMGAVGVLLAALGPWVMPLFVNAADPQAADVIALGASLLWIAAGYQLFDGLQLSSGFALRGAGDVRVPALMFIALSWGVFVPVAHMLAFAPGQGWFDLLPQFGHGAAGGWIGLLVYVILLAAALFLRWRSRRWQQLRI